MRAVVRSRTYHAQLKLLLEIGADRYSAALVQEKLGRLDHTIETHLAAFPRTKQRDPRPKPAPSGYQRIDLHR